LTKAAIRPARIVQTKNVTNKPGDQYMPQDQVSPRDFQALEKRVSALESRVERNTAELNKTLTHAKGADDTLSKRLEKTERAVAEDKTSSRLGKVVEDLNKRLITAKSYDDRLEDKIEALRKKMDKA
jgi:predicted RNase H-like nuclease (RuvC/YqgF family)